MSGLSVPPERSEWVFKTLARLIKNYPNEGQRWILLDLKPTGSSIRWYHPSKRSVW
jgi:hypothetical protein